MYSELISDILKQSSTSTSKIILACIDIIKQVLQDEDSNEEFSYKHVNLIVNFLEAISLNNLDKATPQESKERIGEYICGSNAFKYFRSFRNGLFHGEYFYDSLAFKKIFLKVYNSPNELFKNILIYLKNVDNNLSLLLENKEINNHENIVQNFEQEFIQFGIALGTGNNAERNLMDILSNMLEICRRNLTENSSQPDSDKLFYEFTVQAYNLIHYTHKKVPDFYYSRKFSKKIQDMHGQFVHKFHDSIKMAGELKFYSKEKYAKLIEFYRKYATEFAKIILAENARTILLDNENDFEFELEKCLTNMNAKLSDFEVDFLKSLSSTEDELKSRIMDYFKIFPIIDNTETTKARKQLGFPEFNEYDRIVIYDTMLNVKDQVEDGNEENWSEELKEIISKLELDLRIIGIKKSEFEKMVQRFINNKLTDLENKEIKLYTNKLYIRIIYCQKEVGVTPLESLLSLDKSKRLKDIKIGKYQMKDVDEILVRMLCLNVSFKLFESVEYALEDLEFNQILMDYIASYLSFKEDKSLRIEKMLKRSSLLLPSIVLLLEKASSVSEALKKNIQQEPLPISNKLINDSLKSEARIMYFGRFIENLLNISSSCEEYQTVIGQELIPKIHSQSEQNIVKLLLFKSNPKDYKFNLGLTKELIKDESLPKIVVKVLCNIETKLFQRNIKSDSMIIDTIEKIIRDHSTPTIPEECKFEVLNNLVNIHCKRFGKKLNEATNTNLLNKLQKYLLYTKNYFSSHETSMKLDEQLKYLYDLAYHISTLEMNHNEASQYYERNAKLIISEILDAKDFNYESSLLDIKNLPSWNSYNRESHKSCNILEVIRCVAYEIVQTGKTSKAIEDKDKEIMFVKALKFYCNVRELEKSIGETERNSTKTLIPMANLLNDLSQLSTLSSPKRIEYSVQGLDYLKEIIEISNVKNPVTHPQTKFTLLCFVKRLVHLQKYCSQIQEKQPNIAAEYQSFAKKEIYKPGLKQDDFMISLKKEFEKLGVGKSNA